MKTIAQLLAESSVHPAFVAGVAQAEPEPEPEYHDLAERSVLYAEYVRELRDDCRAIDEPEGQP